MNNPFGQLIRDARLLAGVKLKDLAAEVEICPDRLCHIEAERLGGVFSDIKIPKAAAFLDLDPLVLHLAAASYHGKLGWGVEKIRSVYKVCKGAEKVCYVTTRKGR